MLGSMAIPQSTTIPYHAITHSATTPYHSSVYHHTMQILSLPPHHTIPQSTTIPYHAIHQSATRPYHCSVCHHTMPILSLPPHHTIAQSATIPYIMQLEQYTSHIRQIRRYSPPRRLTSSSCGGLQPLAEAFFAVQAKKELWMLLWLITDHFWCSVVTSVTSSSNLSNLKIIKKYI